MSQIIDTLREQDEEAATSLEIIALEFMRRRHEEGCSKEDDDKHVTRDMAMAAAELAYWAHDPAQPGGIPDGWPLALGKWNPRTPRFALIQACVYAVVELTRLIRSGK